MPSSLKCSYMLLLTRKVCISFLLLFHYGVQQIGGASLPVSSSSSQWNGLCNLVDGLVCGNDVEYFCHGETKRCLPCGAYCTGEYDETKCKRVCPAYYANINIHPPIVTSTVGTTAAGTTDLTTSKAITSEQLTSVTTASLTTLTSKSPTKKPVTAVKKYLFALCFLVIVVIFTVVLIVVCYVKKFRKRQKIKDERDVELTTVALQCTQGNNSRSDPTENCDLLDGNREDEDRVPNGYHDVSASNEHRGSEDSNSTGQSARIENEIPSSEPCEQN